MLAHALGDLSQAGDLWARPSVLILKASSAARLAASFGPRRRLLEGRRAGSPKLGELRGAFFRTSASASFNCF